MFVILFLLRVMCLYESARLYLDYTGLNTTNRFWYVHGMQIIGYKFHVSFNHSFLFRLPITRVILELFFQLSNGLVYVTCITPVVYLSLNFTFYFDSEYLQIQVIVRTKKTTTPVEIE